MQGRKAYKEFTVDSLWGKVALISWGESSKPPLLLVHGFMDTAATFIPLVDKLPDTHYYVALDFPGHGKSDPMPSGVPIIYIYLIEIIRAVVDHMGWDRFTYIGHSLGSILGFHYNFLYPRKIKKMVNLDPVPSFGLFANFIRSNTGRIDWFKVFLESYYNTYCGQNKKVKPVSYERIINSTEKKRHIPREQAEIALSRSIERIDSKMCEITLDPRNKLVASIIMPLETLHKILTTNTPPMLTVVTSKWTETDTMRKYGCDMLEELKNSVSNHQIVCVQGYHDVHIANPDTFLRELVRFLHSDLQNNLQNSKL